MMTNPKILTCLFLLFCLYTPIQVQAQDNCEEVYSSLKDTRTLASFGLVSGPGSFKRKVESSQINENLRNCENLVPQVWEDVLAPITSGTSSGGTGTDPDGTEVKKERKQFFLFRLISALFKSKKKAKVSYKRDMRTAFLITTFGYNASNIEKVKEFVRSDPWDHGYTYASHLAVDILLKQNNDSTRDLDYHTYTLKEMKRAKDLYAGE